jgi:transaldolase
VDTEVDRRLDKIGAARAAALRGKAALANARLAYQRYEWAVSAERWRSLDRAGARPQRPLWASTSVKDPAFVIASGGSAVTVRACLTSMHGSAE